MWLKAYDDVVLPGRPRKGASPPPIPERTPVERPQPIEIHHLDELRALPPHRLDGPWNHSGAEPDARTASSGEAPPPTAEEKPETVSGVVICAVCGRPLPCPVHPAGAKPTAPPIDMPDPAAQAAGSDGKKGRGPGFKGRMGGFVAMGKQLLKGVGADLRAAGKWWAWPDEFVDEFWAPHAEETTAELASLAQEAIGLSDSTVSGMITFGAIGGAIIAKQMLDEEKKSAPVEPPRARPERPPVVNATATEAAPAPPASPPNGANGTQTTDRPRVQLEPELPTVDEY